MRRNFKSGCYSNNSIRYNSYANKKTKNISYLKFEENDYKINCSNTKKELNYMDKYYKIDIDYDEDYEEDDE